MHSDYLDRVFENDYRKSTIESAKRVLSKVEFDAIACRGLSGIVIGSILAHEMDRGLVISRKEKDNSHADCSLEWGGDGRRVLIVDDLICTGDTIRAIVRRIKEWSEYHECPVHLEGILFYNYLLNSMDYESSLGEALYLAPEGRHTSFPVRGAISEAFMALNNPELK